MQFGRFNRREFVTLLGGGATAAWPLSARAQLTMPVIGMLCATQPTDLYKGAFRQGLGEAGYIEGRNASIEIRSADGQFERLPALAADLVARQVNLIAALYTPVPARAARAATKTIPIVFLYGGDPVEDGLVASLNRPGGNVTGITFFIAALTAKRLEVLRELVPKAATIGVLLNSANQLVETQLKDLQIASRTLGQALHVETARNEVEIDAAFAALVRQGAGALLVGADAYFFSRRDRFITLAARHALPTIFSAREIPMAGGLISYGANQPDAHRQAGVYTGQILKGAKPSRAQAVASALVRYFESGRCPVSPTRNTARTGLHLACLPAGRCLANVGDENWHPNWHPIAGNGRGLRGTIA